MRLHHIGFIVKEIENYEKNLLYEEKLSEIFDSKQCAKLALYKNFSNSFIELIQPMSISAFTWGSLEKHGNHFHHFCYEIEKSEMAAVVEQQRLIKILGPIEALLFENREVSFYFTRNKQVVEFLF